MSQSTLWEVISYDVWGNQDDGYEVNAAYTTGRVVEIDDEENDDNVVAALIDAGELVPNAAVDLDGDETCIYVNAKADMYPVLELRKTEQPATGRLQ